MPKNSGKSGCVRIPLDPRLTFRRALPRDLLCDTLHQGSVLEGLTGNLSNEIFSGVLAPFDAVGSAIQGSGFDVGRSFNNLYEEGQKRAQGEALLNPTLSRMGNVTGAAILGSKLGPISPTARATTPLGMAATGAVEGGIYGAIYGAGGAEGQERVLEGAKGFGTGALGGGVVGGTAARILPQVSQEARILGRGMEADGIVPGSVASRLSALGPDAIVADLGPSLQGQAAAIATLPGKGSRNVVDFLSSRRAEANPRIRQDITTALGTPPRPSQVTLEIDAGMDALSPVYQDVLRQKSLSSSPFIDATPLVTSIDDIAARYVGGTRREIERARDLLIDPTTGGPIRDPALLLAARQELDGLIGQEANTTTQGALVEARRLIDESLAANVPGIKQVDADFQDLVRQQEANTRGQTILRDGVTQTSPDDLADELLGMYVPSGVNVGPTNANARRLEQGLVADINRVIGQKANDRVALRNLIRGEGSWNYDNIATVLGKDRADELMTILNREAKFAELENLATSGSRTQVLKAAQDDIQGQVRDPGIIREALNFQYGNAAGKVADRLLGGVISRNRAGVVNNVADALLGKGLTPKMQSEVQRLIDGMTPNEKAIIAALQASQAGSR